MREAGGPSTREVAACFPGCARPTGGRHGLTTDDPVQRFKGAKRRPRQVQWGTSAAKDSIKAGARTAPTLDVVREFVNLLIARRLSRPS
jgi:hypothetical protein